MKNSIYNNRERLTAYAMACGYVETKTLGTVNVTMWHEHATYHVRAHCSEHGRCFWESFRTLTEARKHFDHARALLIATATESVK